MPIALAGILSAILLASSADAQPDSSTTAPPALVGPCDYLVRGGANAWPEQSKGWGRRATISGVVFVRVTVSAVGEVSSKEVVRGMGQRIDQIALDTVDRLEFRAAVADGMPVVGELTVPVFFLPSPGYADYPDCPPE